MVSSRDVPLENRCLDQAKVIGNVEEHGEMFETNSPRFSLFYGTFNLVNDIFTSSIVSVPYFVIVSGLSSGLFLLLLFAVLGHLMLVLLHMLSLEHGFHSLSDTCYSALGTPGHLISTLAIFFFNFGGFLSSLILLGEMLPSTLSYFFDTHVYLFDRRTVLLASMFLLGPLAFKKSLSSLNLLSAVSVSIVSILVLGITVQSLFFTSEIVKPSHSSQDEYRPGIIAGLGGLAYQFSCHDLAYHVSTTLERNTLKRYNIVAALSMYIPLLLLVGFSVCSWLTFGDEITANILDGYGEANGIAVFMRLLLSSNIILNIPYTIFMPREAIISFMHMLRPSWGKKSPHTVHVVSTCIVLTWGFFLANYLTDVGPVFSLVGGISGIAISTVLPALCWIRLGSAVEYNNLLVSGLWCVVGVGVLVMFLTCIDSFL